MGNIKHVTSVLTSGLTSGFCVSPIAYRSYSPDAPTAHLPTMLKNLGPPDFDEYEKRVVISSQLVKRGTGDVVTLYFIGILCLIAGWLKIKTDLIFDQAPFTGILLVIFAFICIVSMPYKTTNEYAFEKMMGIKIYGPNKNTILAAFPKEHYNTLMEQHQNTPITLVLNQGDKTLSYQQDAKGYAKGLDADGGIMLGQIKGNYVHNKNWWFYKGNVWYGDEQLQSDKVQALIEEQLQKQQEKINRRVTREKQQQIDRAKERERALDYDSAIEIWEESGDIEEAARVRKLKAEQGSVKVDQTVVHGDYVDDRDTIVKDSVINRSNIAAGGDDTVTKLEKIANLKREGLIDGDEFKQMKKEILGK